MTRDVTSGKEAQNLLLEEQEKSDSEGRIRAKLAGSCLTAAVYLSYISPYSRSVHPSTEMAVLKQSLWLTRTFLSSLR